MRRRLLLLAGLALVVWATVVALFLVRLMSDLRAGKDAADAARDHLGAEELADLEPLPELRTASKRFSAAHDRAGSIVLAPLRVLPVIGRQLRSVRALSSAAASTADVGGDAVERVGAVLEDPAGTGPDRVEQIRELRNLLDEAADRLGAIDDLGPMQGLLGPLADARNDLAEDLAEATETLDKALTGADAALGLLTGPRRYLVLAANNAEMRAGSGMWLQGGALVTADGDLELEEMVSLPHEADPPDGAVVATGDLGERWGFLEPGNEWRNLMLSPRFAESARLAVEMWSAAGRGKVDGVLAVDAIGLQAIVEATGPVETAEGLLEADRVPQVLLHDQYLAFTDATRDEWELNVERRDGLAELAEAAISAIDDGGYEASTLIRTLGDAIAGRHLLAWSTREDEQRGWEAAGMGGGLSADSLLVSVINRGGNKLDWYLDIEAEMAVEPAADGWDVALELTLENTAPGDEPRYLQGPLPGGEGLEPAEYRGVLAVNVPGAARGSAFDGVDALGVVGADGPTRLVGFQLELTRGESRRVVLRFHLPQRVRSMRIEPSARVPSITWHYESEDWKDSASRTANW